MVEPCEIPDGALLQRYRVDGTFADCYATTVPGHVTLARFVTAFYTTPLFRLERWVLAIAGRGSSDDDAQQLAAGTRDAFAAWTVEARNEHELLLCDVLGRTRSWLMVAAIDEGEPRTRLYFGSAVVPKRDPATGELRLGRSFDVLLRFHRWYSVALLRAAERRLRESF